MIVLNENGEELAVAAVGIVGNSAIDVAVTGPGGTSHCHVFVESDMMRLEWRTDEHEELNNYVKLAARTWTNCGLRR